MKRQDKIALTLIAGLIVAYCAPMLFGWLGIFRDDFYESFPRVFFNATWIKKGVIPLWDPQTFAGGRPNHLPFTELWYWPLYPFYLLAFLKNHDAAFAWLVKLPLFLHWLVCALGMYAFGRRALKLKPVGAATGSLVYAFGPPMSYLVTSPTENYWVVWLPVALWGIVASARDGQRGMGALGAAAVCFMLTPSSAVCGIFALITLLLCLGGMALLHAVAIRRERRKPTTGTHSESMECASHACALFRPSHAWPNKRSMTSLIKNGSTACPEIDSGAAALQRSPLCRMVTRTQARRIIMGGILVVLLGCLLAGPHLAGIIESRALYQDSPLGDVSDWHSELKSMPWRYLLTLLVPDLFGTVTASRATGLACQMASIGNSVFHFEANLTGGFWLLLLCLAGAVAGWERRRQPDEAPQLRQWWLIGAALFIFSLLLVTGCHSPVYRAVSYLIPVFGLPYPLNWRIMGHLGIAIMAGISAQWITDSRLPLPRKTLAAFCMFTIASSFWLWTRPAIDGQATILRDILANHGEWFFRSPIPYLAAAALGTIALITFAGTAVARCLLIGTAVAEVAIIGFLGTYYCSYNAPTPARDRRFCYPSESSYYRWTKNIARLIRNYPITGPERTAFFYSKLDQVATLHGGEYLFGNPSKPMEPRMAGILTRITENWPYDLKLTAPESRFLPHMSVRHLIYPSVTDLHRLDDTMPRVFTQDMIVHCTEDEAREELLNGNLREAAFIEEKNRLPEGATETHSYEEFKKISTAPHTFGELQALNRIHRVTQPTPNRMRIDVTIMKPALLITTDVFYPGWRVTIDGHPALPLRANYLQRAVRLEKGRHTVEWKFQPTGVRWGFAAFCLGVLGLTLLPLFPRPKNSHQLQ